MLLISLKQQFKTKNSIYVTGGGGWNDGGDGVGGGGVDEGWKDVRGFRYIE